MQSRNVAQAGARRIAAKSWAAAAAARARDPPFLPGFRGLAVRGAGPGEGVRWLCRRSEEASDDDAGRRVADRGLQVLPSFLLGRVARMLVPVLVLVAEQSGRWLSSHRQAASKLRA